MKILYFTSTGNNLYIAKSLNGELLSIPQLIKEKNYNIKDEVLGIIFPVYYYSVPQIVIDYIKKAQLTCDYLFAIASYGSAEFGAKRALHEINKILSNQVNYTNHVLMVDNYLPMFDIEKEIQIKKNNDIDNKIKSIKRDIEKRKINKTSKIGDIIFSDMILKKPMTTLFKLKIKNEGCINCKICQKVCPRDNIILDGKKPIIGNDCEFCLGCVHHCKKHIINTNHEKSSKRYINPEIKLSEIIKSNE